MTLRERIIGRLPLMFYLNLLWLTLCAAFLLIGSSFGVVELAVVTYLVFTGVLGLAGMRGLARNAAWAPRILDLSVFLALPPGIFSVLLAIVAWAFMPGMIEAFDGAWYAYIGAIMATVLAIGGGLNMAALVWLRLGHADTMIWEGQAAQREFERGMNVHDETELDFGQTETETAPAEVEELHAR